MKERGLESWEHLRGEKLLGSRVKGICEASGEKQVPDTSGEELDTMLPTSGV